MKFTKKIQQALNFAAQKHDGQKRKSSKLPYIIHPFSVAIILSNYTDDEEIIVAGLLHDLVEDVDNIDFEDLKDKFGQRVVDIIKGISEDKDSHNGLSDKESWQDRKDEYLEKLKKDSQDSLLVCAADKIHNLQSMNMIYEIQGEGMWNDFNAPVEKQIWYYGEVLKILKERLKKEIVDELDKKFEEFKKLVKT